MCQSLLFNKVAGPGLWHKCFPVNFCEISKNTFFHRTPLVATSGNLTKVVNFCFFYPFIYFSILNFAMAEWFCHVTCFSKVYVILSFFSYKHDIFIIKKFRSCRPEMFCNKVFLEILQTSQENTCARVAFLIKLQA